MNNTEDTQTRPAAVEWLIGKAALIPALLACVAIGYFLHWALSPAVERSPGGRSSNAAARTEAQLFICPMNYSHHPYFSSTDPQEKCGYCSMPLVAASKEQMKKGDPNRTSLSAEAVALLDGHTPPGCSARRRNTSSPSRNSEIPESPCSFRTSCWTFESSPGNLHPISRIFVVFGS